MIVPPLSELTLTGARCLVDGAMQDGMLTIRDGFIDFDAGGQHLALDGYDVLPGIIDLHGDAFEHHIAPRPTAPFPIELGLTGTDRDAAAHGVTTAWMAQSWSWEGAARGPDFAEAFLAAHQTLKPNLLTDLRVQIRCETHTVETEERLINAVRDFGVDYVIFNNHLDEAIEIAQKYPERIGAWASRAGRTSEEHMEVVRRTKESGPRVPRYLCNLAVAFDNLGVRYGSHDDGDANTRDYYSNIGAKICEFPTHRSAAAIARTLGDPVVMGAPNVVRGGSQAGNISAAMLIREGLCDALVSDYHYPTLAQAAQALADQGLKDFADAWALISTRPAQIMGLTDRGTLAQGKRADLVIRNRENRQIEATMVGGRWSYLSNGVAHRLSQAPRAMRHAAE
ncbi:alpha-D-ribose 1-methylphosphonate 5-triphosphate diphosphatase [Cognatiyoonia sp. IB215446]|uniref:alpha-D-ribose 1-methylphosphonate 5-triphosphate diphosphatase n=1 Tax=Cognatiyoonia sp. IB215446 TaxID=3097355 RepID=UPI002A14F27A|nr:alpha-D-ribose 1-methylphosphonate 5-triphosphate diphosphatase [Cognatiyoonia sp. IB215446]MDX8346834.1 alpha-D-ribose 1-methylphosphonate 5-triphosphate diphosphatase [Cognatiyoonia sp. IB215446]